jgi:nitroreductase
MKIGTAIRSRRAVRDYAPQPVPMSVLHQLITAASWAPSAMNEQPCHYTVVTDAAVLDEISRNAKDWLLNKVGELPRSDHFRDLLSDPHYHLFYHAPALVVISAPDDRQWGAEDCALAAQNLMLAAVEHGVGSCWIGFAQGWLNTDDGRRILGLTAHSHVVAPIILGYSKAPPPPVPRKAPIVNWIGDMIPPLPTRGNL